MSQSDVIALFLLLGFVVFITERGELAKYLATFGIAGNASALGYTGT